MLIALYDVISWDARVMPSTLKAFIKFGGTCFKFWRRPWCVKYDFVAPLNTAATTVKLTLSIYDLFSQSY